MLTSPWTRDHLHMKNNKVCNKTRSPPVSLLFKGQGTEHTTQEIISRETRLHLTFSANWNKRDKVWRNVIEVTFSLPLPVVDAKAPCFGPSGRSSHSRRLDYNELVNRQWLSLVQWTPKNRYFTTERGGRLQTTTTATYSRVHLRSFKLYSRFLQHAILLEVDWFLLTIYGGPRREDIPLQKE